MNLKILSWIKGFIEDVIGVLLLIIATGLIGMLHFAIIYAPIRALGLIFQTQFPIWPIILAASLFAFPTIGMAVQRILNYCDLRNTLKKGL